VGRISRLPEALANRIAAGEVVVRPSFVVKELLENAIDAHASSVHVVTGSGGTGLMRVVDDGCGMDPEDVALCLERHATSKLSSASDLDSIQTLGFRGEALPSIASVSRFSLRSRCEGQPCAAEVRVEGGRLLSTSSVGGPPGTCVEVRDLFFNAPARRKFLKSPASENREIRRVAAEFALAYPSLAFSLEMEGQEKHRFGHGVRFEERIRFLFGKETSASLQEISADEENVKIHGWVAGAEHAKGRGMAGLIVLNGRPIYDRALFKAIWDGYGGLVPKGKIPICVIHIEMAPDRLDVNVHPSKLEVRFRDGALLYGMLSRAVRAVLWGQRQGQSVPSQGERRAFHGFQETIHSKEHLIVREPSSEQRGAAAWDATDPTEARVAVSIEASWLIQGQVGDTYIVCEDEEGMILVDQHAAHERILFDRLLKGIRDRGLPTQDLLVPHVVEVSLGEEEMEGPLKDHLMSLGFDVEPFGPGQLSVRSVPAFVGEAITPQSMVEILNAYQENQSLPKNERLIQMARRISCRAAIMAGESLSMEEMRGLVKDLSELDEGARCPHGRPISVRMSFLELERLFGRR